MEENKQKTIKVKFNAYVAPKVIWNEKTKSFETIANKKDFRHEVVKLLTEEGDTPEETKALQNKRTALMIRNGMLSLNEAVDMVCGNINDKDQREFYFKNDIVSLSEKEAEYYLKTPCGGQVVLRDANKKLITTNHKENIDGRAGFYEARDMARFEREHAPLMMAEVYNG